jgi:hypothetical protein
MACNQQSSTEDAFASSAMRNHFQRSQDKEECRRHQEYVDLRVLHSFELSCPAVLTSLVA